MSYCIDLPFVRLRSDAPPELRKQVALSLRRQVGSNSSVSGVTVDFQHGGVHSSVSLSSENHSGWYEVRRVGKSPAEFRWAVCSAIVNTLRSLQVFDDEIERLISTVRVVLSRGNAGRDVVRSKLPIAEIRRAFQDANISDSTLEKCQFRVVSEYGLHATADVGLGLADESGYRMSGTSASVNLWVQMGAGFLLGTKPGSVKFVCETPTVQLDVRLFDRQTPGIANAQPVSPILEEQTEETKVWWTNEMEEEVGGYESENDLE